MSIVTPDFKQQSASNARTPQRSASYLQKQSQSPLPSCVSSLPLSSEADETHQQWVVLNQYLQDSGLLQVFNSWVCLIAGLEELPYNPYPTLAWYARQHAERFHMFTREEDVIYQTIDGEVFNTGGHVSRTQDNPARWGLRPILKAVDTKSLQQFDWLLSTISLHVALNDSTDNSYIIHTPVPVLVGPCVFSGSFYHEIPTIQLQLEYGIAGPNIDYAAQIFAELLLGHIKRLEEDDVHILLEVSVPQHDDNYGWRDVSWTNETVNESQEEFLLMVQQAAKAQKLIVSKTLFKLDPNNRHYKRGEIQYNLTIIRLEPGRTLCQSATPYLSAYQGVFTSHSSLVGYLAWFENIERPEITPEFREPTTSTTKRSTGLFTRSKGKSNNVSAMKSNSDAHSRTRTALGGLTSGTTDSSVYPEEGPYAQDIRENIRIYLSRKVAAFPGEENLFPMLHYVILMLLLDRDSEDAQQSLVEASRLLQSTLYRVYLLTERNALLQALVTRFSTIESVDSYVVQSFYLEYREHLKDLLCNELLERSSEFNIAGRVLLDRLDAMEVRPRTHASRSGGIRSLPLNMQVVEELQWINRYCVTLVFGLVDDALSFCPTLKRHFPPINTSGHNLFSSYQFKHGVEAVSVLNQDSMYLNMEKAQKTIPAPAAISSQAAILKYFVDVKLDQTFEAFLGHVLSGSSLPPNPYPSLVSHLRAAAVSMELFGEKRDRLVSRLLPASAQVVDTKNYIYSVPGSEAYGVLSTLRALDSKHYNELLIKLNIVLNKVSSRVTDQGIKTTVGVALTGFSPLYGRLMPYIHEIELDEHYFLQGPVNGKMDALNYFTKLVYDHFVGFAEEDSTLFVGVFLGGTRRSLLDIVSAGKKISFLSQLLTTVRQEKPVYMKAYIKIDWRLVLVKKTFLLHYIEGQFSGYHRFFTPSPLVYYQNVFTSQAAASLFARTCGPQDKSDPCKGENLRMSLVHVNHFIERARHDGDLLSVYRWLLVKSLMSQSSSHVVEAWYMLHSAAAQLEYLIMLNKTLQNLVYEELSRTFVPAKEDASNTASLLDVTVLGEMVQAYCQKLCKVLEHSTCMTPSGTMNLLQDKLREATEVDRTSNTLRLKINQQTPRILQEINEFLQPLLDAAADDIHQVCPNTQHALLSIAAEIHGNQLPGENRSTGGSQSGTNI